MVDDDDGRMDDGRTPDHGHPISSPCEPNGSGELISLVPRGVLKTSGFAFSFQHSPWNLANVNEWKIIFDPFTDIHVGCSQSH